MLHQANWERLWGFNPTIRAGRVPHVELLGLLIFTTASLPHLLCPQCEPALIVREWGASDSSASFRAIDPHGAGCELVINRSSVYGWVLGLYTCWITSLDTVFPSLQLQYERDFCRKGGLHNPQKYRLRSCFYNLSYTVAYFGNVLALLLLHVYLKPLTAALLPPVLQRMATVWCGRSVWVVLYAEMWEVRQPRSGSVGNLQMF